MNSFSHSLIGKILLRQLDDRYDIKLDRRAFLYGSVMPDFRKTYKTLPHEARFWEGYLKGEITALARQRRETRRFDRSCSKRLGILCHFYADFFCLAHTDGFNGSTYEHIRYEWDLDRFLRKNADGLYQADLRVRTPAVLSADTIYGDFHSLQTRYAQHKPDFMCDLSFTLRACAGAMTAIADSSLAAPEKPALLGKLIAGAASG